MQKVKNKIPSSFEFAKEIRVLVLLKMSEQNKKLTTSIKKLKFVY